jgi:hypothetical protein
MRSVLSRRGTRAGTRGADASHGTDIEPGYRAHAQALRWRAWYGGSLLARSTRSPRLTTVMRQGGAEEAKMTEPEPEFDVEPGGEVDEAPAVEHWWQGVLAVEHAFEPEPPDVIRRMRLNGLVDPDHE